MNKVENINIDKYILYKFNTVHGICPSIIFGIIFAMLLASCNVSGSGNTDTSFNDDGNSDSGVSDVGIDTGWDAEAPDCGSDVDSDTGIDYDGNILIDAGNDGGELTDAGFDGGVDTQCLGKPDFTRCTLANPLYKYNICIEEKCIMPGCGDKSCNTPGPNFIIPPDANPFSYYLDTSMPEEPTVYDYVTHLTWQGCPAGLTGTKCLGTSLKKKWEDGIAYCDTLQWGGYFDWRLPNREELLSIVDYYGWAPAIDLVFARTPRDDFWTITTHSGDYNDNAIIVNFDYGFMNQDQKTHLLDIRCVRGDAGIVTIRFDRRKTAIDQPVVYDYVTKLTWQGCAAGLSGDDCSKGSAVLMNWTDAYNYCSNLNWGGQSSGWKLPNAKEYMSIISGLHFGPAIDAKYFPNTPGGMFDKYWSNTVSRRLDFLAWGMHLEYGSNYFFNKIESYKVRCVH